MSNDVDNFDVGIIGVAVGANYGSVLTYYSLYRTIESFGKKVLMISKIGAKSTDPEIQNTHAIKFAKMHYNLSKVYSQETVKELNDIVDTFVIGSDQVWNYGVSQHFGKSFYLDFANDNKRKISYAASFGHGKDFAPPEEVVEISALMKRFNAISVREDSGVKIAGDVYQASAKQVAEPIFLTSAEDYMELAKHSNRNLESPYLLAYILDPTPEKRDAIKHIAGKLGLDIRIVLDGWPNLFEQNKNKMGLPANIEENVNTYDFLKLYANCSYVLTDSFHGTAFAIRFEKPFASIGNRRRGLTRFDSMFRLIGHRSRFTQNPEIIIKEDARFLAPLDYRKINDLLDKHVENSKDWLKQALVKPITETVEVVGSNTHKVMGTIPRQPLRPSKAIKRVFGFFKNRLGNERFRIRAPLFTANNEVWNSEALPDKTRLTVASSGTTIRGNLVWTDLPVTLKEKAGYELTIEWSVRTLSPSVNIHIRNPETGKYRVVGTISVQNSAEVSRTDAISFIVPGEGFSQIMLGAIHFTGINAGADIFNINIKSISPESVIPNSSPITSKNLVKDPVTVTKELRHADNERFLNSYAQHRFSRSVGNARSLMMYYSHGFEKGLSRTNNFRPGFGEATMKQLASEMNKWVVDGHSIDDSFFQIAASVMRAYFERHRAINFDVSNFLKFFNPPVQAAIEKASAALGGALAVSALREVTMNNIQERPFTDVVFDRRSVREFIARPVMDEDIRRAVQIALQAPSVCNRQPVRVHQIQDTNIMRAVLDLQGGFRGYKMPPSLLLVTSDLSAFVAAVERNQAFIDGGLFMMLLLLGLEQVGLGSCSLNTAMGKERESAIRKILNLPESEVLIAFIAVGHFDPTVMIPRSKRLPVEEILFSHAKH